MFAICGSNCWILRTKGLYQKCRYAKGQLKQVEQTKQSNTWVSTKGSKNKNRIHKSINKRKVKFLRFWSAKYFKWKPFCFWNCSVIESTERKTRQERQGGGWPTGRYLDYIIIATRTETYKKLEIKCRKQECLAASTRPSLQLMIMIS